MKFLKLHSGGNELLVNMSIVSEIFNSTGNNGHSKSLLYFNFEVDGMQTNIRVDESVDEIYEKLLD